MEFPKNLKTTNQEKPRSVAELIGEAPDAVVVVSGASKYNDKKGRYEMGSFSDVDDSGLVAGGKERVIAAVEMYNSFPGSTFVATSQNADPTIPTYASIIVAELIRMGIPAEKVVEENQSYRTVDGLKHTLLLSRERGWNKIVFLTSGYHVPRVRTMLEHILEFSQDKEEQALLLDIKKAIERGVFVVQVVSADDILPFRSKHYDTYLDTVKELPGYQARVASEQKGVQDIKTGKYIFSAPIKKIPDVPEQS